MLHFLVLFVHVLGACIMVGSSLISLHLAVSQKITRDVIKQFKIIKKAVPLATGIQLITGIMLFLMEPEKFSHNVLFWTKVSLFFLTGLFSHFVIIKEARRFMKGNREINNRLHWLFAVECLLLLSIVFIGVWLVDNG